MRYLVLFFTALFVFITPVSAINWQEVKNYHGESAYVDLDSIKVYNNYYFYNIRVNNTYKNQEVIITMQSRKSGGMGARINFYTPSDYENLNGDYENITSKMTENFEPVEYGSLASECFSLVKSIIYSQQLKIVY